MWRGRDAGQQVLRGAGPEGYGYRGKRSLLKRWHLHFLITWMSAAETSNLPSQLRIGAVGPMVWPFAWAAYCFLDHTKHRGPKWRLQEPARVSC